MDVEGNLTLFEELIQCACPVYLWVYDADGQLEKTNCPEEDIFAKAFSMFGCKDDMFKFATRQSAPLFLSSPLGLNWIGTSEHEDGALKRVYLIGPIFSTMVSFDSVEKALRKNSDLEISLAWQAAFMRALEHVPVLMQNMLMHYGVMLHCCVTGERLKTSDISHNVRETQMTADGKLDTKDRHKVWQTEQALLRMVREGDLNYTPVIARAQSVSVGIPVLTKDHLRQAKTSVIVYTSLCTRASIEGGLSPDQAYALGDAYIQSVEDCTVAAEIAAISDTMYRDFIQRVHKCRTNPNLSKQIQECCNYIEMNVEGTLDTETLAKRVGYAEYYLTRKFKAEMNVSLNEYIKIARVERAKLLLITTDQSILEISERLGYCARSHLSASFRGLVGCSPAEYRKTHQRV